MNRPELFSRSVDVLVRAFFDGTLAAGTCYACAVGNLFAAAKGARIDLGTDSVVLPDGSRPVGSLDRWGLRVFEFRHGVGPDGPTAVGYSIAELERIEGAFESSVRLGFRQYARFPQSAVLADQFAGLMAVVDVLQAIHGADDAAAEAARGRLRSHPALAVEAR